MFLPSRIACCLLLSACPLVVQADWKQWRGEQQHGVAPDGDYPTKWSSKEGISWQIETPGHGGSTPIVADGRVYVTTNTVGDREDPADGENKLICYAADTGNELWNVTLGHERPSKGGNNRKGSEANPSVVAEEDGIFAYFRSGDLGCVSPDGEVRWHINLQDKYGQDTLWWNLGTSPIPTENALVVAVMQSGEPETSYVVGVDKQSGEINWKVDRHTGAPLESADAYTTPLLLDIDGRSVIAILGGDHLTLHDPANGEELARLGGFNPGGDKNFRSIASPVAAGNIVICPYARGRTLTAVDAKQLLDGTGKDAVAWFRDDLGSDAPTPAATDDEVYIARDRGGLVCVDAKTGKDLWEARPPRSRHGITSSPLVAGDHVYLTYEDGTTVVIDRTNEGEIVSINEAGTGEPFTIASLVPVGSDLLQRTRHRLLRIEGTK